MNLWSSPACAGWQAAAAAYPAVIQAQQVPGLEELDRWYRQDLPRLITARSPACITLAELVQVTAWKMKRGVWRARNRWLVAGNAPAAVEQASRAAFAAVPDPRRPLTLLSTLAGVGPATASAVLAAYRPDVYPFFDDLVATQIPDLGPVAYTPAYYQRYTAQLRTRAAELCRDCPPPAWTAHDLSQALWAASGGKSARSRPGATARAGD